MLFRDIVIIGSGNLATNLACALYEKSKNIVSIYSRKIENAKLLADTCKASYTNSIEELPESADLYIIAVNDASIIDIVKKLSGVNGMMVHTSGSIPISVFPDTIKYYGVLYPLMVFSKTRQLNFKDIPLCLEANSTKAIIELQLFAKTLSGNISIVSSEHRKILHLAAVFACNFANLNYAIAYDLLSRNGLSYDLLKPMILQTARNVKSGNPMNYQTGPAVRNDRIVMDQHLKMLSEMPNFKEIYEQLSEQIITLKTYYDQL